MTAQLQLFMILGAVVLLLIIFAFLNSRPASDKYRLLPHPLPRSMVP